MFQGNALVLSLTLRLRCQRQWAQFNSTLRCQFNLKLRCQFNLMLRCPSNLTLRLRCQRQ